MFLNVVRVQILFLIILLNSVIEIRLLLLLKYRFYVRLMLVEWCGCRLVLFCLMVQKFLFFLLLLQLVLVVWVMLFGVGWFSVWLVEKCRCWFLFSLNVVFNEGSRLLQLLFVLWKVEVYVVFLLLLNGLQVLKWVWLQCRLLISSSWFQVQCVDIQVLVMFFMYLQLLVKLVFGYVVLLLFSFGSSFLFYLWLLISGKFGMLFSSVEFGYR